MVKLTSGAPIFHFFLFSAVAVLLWPSSTTTTHAATDAHRLRVRGLKGDRPRDGKYKNPCTGSWSNDAFVLTIEDCDEYLAGLENPGSDSGLDGGSGVSKGEHGNDRGDIGAGDGSSNFDCSIHHNDDPTSPTVNRTIEYWYCVKTTSDNTTWLPILEEKIFKVAKDRLTWCIGYPLRRQLLEAQDFARRRLGVEGVSSQPTDKIRSDVNYPEDCYVVQGGFTIEAREADDLNNTIQSVLFEVEDSMAKDELLSDDIPQVTEVIYLGESQEDVENANIVAGVVGSTTGGEEPKNNDADGIVIGICTSLLLLAIILLLLLVRRRRRDESAARFLALDDDGQGFKPLPGTGDPPGSFHHGVHHYFRDGQMYLSTNCYDCHETRMLSNSDVGGVLPPTMVDHSDGYYDKLVTANSKDIGNDHSAMNVHKCTSSTCNLCLADSKKEVTIVKVSSKPLARPKSRVYDDNFGVAHSTYDL